MLIKLVVHTYDNDVACVSSVSTVQCEFQWINFQFANYIMCGMFKGIKRIVVFL